MWWETTEHFQSIASALAPGFVIMLVRRQFGVYDTQTTQDKLLTYTIVSILYLAIFLPLFAILDKQSPAEWVTYIAPVFQSFILPALIGVLWAWVATKDPFHGLWRRLGLQPIHHTPNAWDYLFATIQGDAWVVVTLNNGEQIAGKYGLGAFASTDKNERDLLLSEVWELSEGEWSSPKATKKMLLCGKDIQSIEVFHPSKEEEKIENE